MSPLCSGLFFAVEKTAMALTNFLRHGAIKNRLKLLAGALKSLSGGLYWRHV